MLLTLSPLPARRRRRSRRSCSNQPAEQFEPRVCLSASSLICADEFVLDDADADLDEIELALWDESSTGDDGYFYESSFELFWQDEVVWDDGWQEDESFDSDWLLDDSVDFETDQFFLDDFILVETVESLVPWLYDDAYDVEVYEFPFGNDALMPDEILIDDGPIDPDSIDSGMDYDAGIESDFGEYEIVIVVETVEDLTPWLDDYETESGSDLDGWDEDPFEADPFEADSGDELFVDDFATEDVVVDETADEEFIEFDGSLIETVIIVDGEIVFGGELPFDSDPDDFGPDHGEGFDDEFAEGPTPFDDSGEPVFDDGSDFDQTESKPTGSDSGEPKLDALPARSPASDVTREDRLSGHRDVDREARRTRTGHPDRGLKSEVEHRHDRLSRRKHAANAKIDAARSRFAAELASSHTPSTAQPQHTGEAARQTPVSPREMAARQFREARARIQTGQSVNPMAMTVFAMNGAALAATSEPGSVAGWNDAVWSSERLTMALSELPDPQLDDTTDDGNVTCAQVVSAAGAAAIAGSFGFQFAERRGFDLLRRLAALLLRRA